MFKTGVNMINHTVNTSIMPAKRPVAACGRPIRRRARSTWRQSERHPETPYYKLPAPRARMFGASICTTVRPIAILTPAANPQQVMSVHKVRKLGANTTRISDIEPANCAKAMARPRRSIGRLRKSRSDVNIVPPQKQKFIMLISICPPPNTLRTISGKATMNMPMKKIPTEMVDKITG